MSQPKTSAGIIVFALWLLVFAASSQIMIITPILGQIGEELGIGESALGTLVSSYSIMVGIFAIVAGPISDKTGRRRILLLGTGVMTGALLMHHFVVGYFSFLAVRVGAVGSNWLRSGCRRGRPALQPFRILEQHRPRSHRRTDHGGHHRVPRAGAGTSRRIVPSACNGIVTGSHILPA